MKQKFKIIFRFLAFTLIILPALLFFSSKAFADTQSFGSSADSYLQSSSPNVNNGSEVMMDLTNNRDGVVRFDISAIPFGSTITSATLVLEATAVGSATAVKNYGAHRILTDWNEDAVTWNTPGSAAGTHFTASPTETIAVSAKGSYSWNVTGDVADFVNGGAINYGWRIIWSSNANGTNKQVDFGTKENVTALNRPILNITYTPPVATDVAAPAAVSDLTASSPSSSAITLAWTSPGDDGNSGTASLYDIRYSADNITDESWPLAEQVLGEPAPLSAGASQSMAVAGLSASTVYFFAMKTWDEVPNTSNLSNVLSLATLAEEGGGDEGDKEDEVGGEEEEEGGEGEETLPGAANGGGITMRQAIFSGYAYPGSFIEIFQKSIVDESYFVKINSENIKVADDGSFLASYTGLINTDYLFSLRIEDKDGRSAGILAFNVLLSNDLFEVKNIIAPPTIGFEKASIVKNEVIKILGYATPYNVVELEVDGLKYKETKADQFGFWNFDVDTAHLAYGDHSARARQIALDAKSSNFSLTRIFKLSKAIISKGDLNSDNIVDIRDWSIFLFRWGNEDSALRLQNDINEDGEVNIFDFSLFLQAIKI